MAGFVSENKGRTLVESTSLFQRTSKSRALTVTWKPWRNKAHDIAVAFSDFAVSAEPIANFPNHPKDPVYGCGLEVTPSAVCLGHGGSGLYHDGEAKVPMPVNKFFLITTTLSPVLPASEGFHFLNQ